MKMKTWVLFRLPVAGKKPDGYLLMVGIVVTLISSGSPLPDSAVHNRQAADVVLKFRDSSTKWNSIQYQSSYWGRDWFVQSCQHVSAENFKDFQNLMNSEVANYSQNIIAADLKYDLIHLAGVSI